MIQRILYGDTLQQQVDCNKSRWCGELSHLSSSILGEGGGVYRARVWRVVCLRETTCATMQLVVGFLHQQLMCYSQRFLHTSPFIRRTHCFCLAEAVPSLPFELIIVYTYRQSFYLVNYFNCNLKSMHNFSLIYCFLMKRSDFYFFGW